MQSCLLLLRTAALVLPLYIGVLVVRRPSVLSRMGCLCCCSTAANRTIVRQVPNASSGVVPILSSSNATEGLPAETNRTNSGTRAVRPAGDDEMLCG
jgi:hypothetical protein